MIRITDNDGPDDAAELSELVINRKQFAVRLRDLKAGQSEAEFAKSIGVSQTAVNQYLNAKQDPKSPVLARISTRYGVSLDWLVFGGVAAGSQKGEAASPSPRPAAPLDVDLLKQALTLVDEWLAKNRRAMPPSKKAEVVSMIYQFAIEDQALGKEPIDTHRVAQFLRLVA
ncbi:helix-turn-helix domain-containing protein [Xanthobacter sp. DSM 24535]|uniref:helix-turn-helix domain-containing protein n=1 Tax=Roseixanthobacter psychrophilus TaxID=3119917 RepID=UPI00372A8BC7